MVGSSSAGRVDAGIRRPRPERAIPQRSAAFAHLDLAGLRIHRAALATEEGRVSYWRRILQARVDLLRGGGRAGSSPLELGRLLSENRVAQGRRALVEVLADAGDVPPLPDLATLWARDAGGTDPTLLPDLLTAERQLSAYRLALHLRLSDATTELIARYREDPRLCLSALPLRQSPGSARLVPAPSAAAGR